MSYELLFCIPVTSYYLLHEFQVTFKDDLGVTIYCTSYGLNLSYKLRVTIARVGIAILIVESFSTISAIIKRTHDAKSVFIFIYHIIYN